MNILSPSIQSLLIKTRDHRGEFSSATGFILNSIKYPLLITNRHVVTGLDNFTKEGLDQNGRIPTELVIRHNLASKLGSWIDKIEPLYHDDKPLWIEHPILKDTCDIVALPLTNIFEVDLHPYSLDFTEPQIRLSPADIVSVVGFPFGKAGGGSLAIWATGFLATEPDVNYGGNPVFLIDCRTRPGQSGSAVIAHRNGGNIRLNNGKTVFSARHKTYFLGAYSGRINRESDIGMVWKASALKELVDSIR